jgi:hypothetical protein
MKKISFISGSVPHAACFIVKMEAVCTFEPSVMPTELQYATKKFTIASVKSSKDMKNIT